MRNPTVNGIYTEIPFFPGVPALAAAAPPAAGDARGAIGGTLTPRPAVWSLRGPLAPQQSRGSPGTARAGVPGANTSGRVGSGHRDPAGAAPAAPLCRRSVAKAFPASVRVRELVLCWVGWGRRVQLSPRVVTWLCFSALQNSEGFVSSFGKNPGAGVTHRAPSLELALLPLA